MKKNKYFIIILLISCSILAMENSEKIDDKQPGIFLETIVSEYEKPVKITRMWLEKHFSGDWFVKEDYSRNLLPLAVVWKEKIWLNNPQIETDLKFTAYGNDRYAIIREIACLRIEDVVTGAKQDVWMRKYLKHQENLGKRGCFFVNGKTIEKFDFGCDQLSHTRVTLQLNTTRLEPINMVVTSKTTCLNQRYELDESNYGGPP